MRIALVLTIAACASSDREWTVDQRTSDGVLLGVWGSGPHDVWAVGGQADRPLVLHGDGTSWARVAAPGSSLLSNVYGFSDSDVYAVGEHGLVIHYDGQTWTQVESGTDAPLFGIWGASGADVWVVGGSPAPVVLRGTAAAFTAVALPPDLAPSTVFKAHGFAANDVFMVDTTGVLRWNGLDWRRDAVPTTEPLLSTWGRGPTDVYAVGGRTAGDIIHFDGRQWSLVAQLPIGAGLPGVYAAPDGTTLAVSTNGCIFELADQGVVQSQLVGTALHGVWGDYVVGGDLLAYPDAMTGVIFRR